MSDLNPTTMTPAAPAPASAQPLLPATISQPDCPLSFTTRQGLEGLQRVGKLFSASPLVPDTYQGDKGIASCAIAVDLANRLGANALMVMQNLYIVHGRPGWSAKFKIGTFNQCGRFSPIRYEFGGTEGQDDWSCRAWAIEKATGERVQGPKVTIAIAKAEGWYAKNGSKWKTMPELMLCYRSAGELVDTVAPELSMGLPMADDIEDSIGTIPADATVIPTPAGAQVLQAEVMPPAAPTPPAAASGRLARLRQPKDVTPKEPDEPGEDPAIQAETNAYEASLEEYARVLKDKGRPEAFVTSALNSWKANVNPDRVARLHQAIQEAQTAPAQAAAATSRAKNPDDKAPTAQTLVDPNDPENDLPWPTE
jgi:hypothetical protein